MTDRMGALLRIALHHDVREDNADFAIPRLAALAGGALTTTQWAEALGDAIAAGLIHDPIRLADGALQCHWHLQLTAKGLAQARRLVG